MRQFPRAVLLIAGIGILVAPVVGRALPPLRWGPAGHRIIATIAQDRLSPAANAEARRLLGGQSLADVASWADDVRRDQPNTAPWHYIDIEVTDTSYVPARDCKEGACVIEALHAQFDILGDHKRSDAERAVALKWVVHLTGDLHQPLHSGERADRGGNDVKVMFQGRLTNLHALWDSGLLTSYGQQESDVIRQLEDSIAHRGDIAKIAAGPVVHWVMESHDIARDVVYKNLGSTNDITAEYAAAAQPVIYDRLMRAGVRLAAMLERALGH